jgi:hypothetical protein
MRRQNAEYGTRDIGNTMDTLNFRLKELGELTELRNESRFKDDEP